MLEQRRQLSLGWQVVLLLVCLCLGDNLTDVYGARLAALLHADFESARTPIVVFFAAVVGIVGILAWRSVRMLTRMVRGGATGDESNAE